MNKSKVIYDFICHVAYVGCCFNIVEESFCDADNEVIYKQMMDSFGELMKFYSMLEGCLREGKITEEEMDARLRGFILYVSQQCYKRFFKKFQRLLSENGISDTEYDVKKKYMEIKKKNRSAEFRADDIFELLTNVREYEEQKLTKTMQESI